MKDLKTQEGREKAIKELNGNFIKELRIIGIELAEGAVCEIYDYNISVNVNTNGSQIELYAQTKTDSKFLYDKNRVNCGTSGSFTPENKGAYWMFIHTASILKNWEKTSELVNKYCQLYRELCNEIHAQNQ